MQNELNIFGAQCKTIKLFNVSRIIFKVIKCQWFLKMENLLKTNKFTTTTNIFRFFEKKTKNLESNKWTTNRNGFSKKFRIEQFSCFLLIDNNNWNFFLSFQSNTCFWKLKDTLHYLYSFIRWSVTCTLFAINISSCLLCTVFFFFRSDQYLWSNLHNFFIFFIPWLLSKEKKACLQSTFYSIIYIIWIL